MMKWPPDFVFKAALVSVAMALACQAAWPRSGAAPEEALPFAEYADAFAKEAGIEDLKRDPASLTPALERSCVAVQLGLFDVWFPRAPLKDKKMADRFEGAVGVLLDLQDRWVEWAGDEESVKATAGDLGIIRKWLKSWKLAKIARAADNEAGRPGLAKLLEAGEEEIAALNAFEQRMLLAEYMGRKDEATPPVLLIFAPDRGTFLRLGSYIGSLSEEYKPSCWTKSLATWTTLNCLHIHVIAMEYPGTVPGLGDITQGQDMNKDSKTGLLQHVLWNATDLLVTQYQFGNLPRELIVGLAMNMVIEDFKEIEVRTGTGSAGKKLAAYSVFVAGGASTGGTLPGRKAKPDESRWRQDKGKDYFIGMLRKVQKEGAKLAAKEKKGGWSKIGCFPILADTGATEYVARAPFLMDTEDVEPVPPECLSDHKEFAFAYQCAFAYWLRTKAGGAASEDPPEALARKYLGASRIRPPGAPAIELGVYGVPLSGEDESRESLEWKFLEWLAKGKK